jgi:ubiquinone/menaquinone biosynthesis C-methylase UbiE
MRLQGMVEGLVSMNQTPRWYDKLSIAHDLLSFRDWPYWRARKQAVSALELPRGDTVVALFCGTGTSFHWIIPQIGRSGTLSSVDGSPGILARATASSAEPLGYEPDRAG